MAGASRNFKNIAAGVALLLAFGGAPAFAEGDINMIRIDQMTVGKTPPGFSFAHTGQGSDGAWTVVADPTAKGGLAIEQTSTDTTDYRFPTRHTWQLVGEGPESRNQVQGGGRQG